MQALKPDTAIFDQRCALRIFFLTSVLHVRVYAEHVNAAPVFRLCGLKRGRSTDTASSPDCRRLRHSCLFTRDFVLLTTIIMEGTICNIQVLLRAAEFLERREREAEHGYASLLPLSPDDSDKRSKQKNRKISAAGGGNRSVHNELEKNRRAQLRHHLEELKKQVPLSSDSMRNTTLNLLRRAQLHIKKLQEQDERAEQMKGRLRWEQRELRVRLEQLQRGSERMRNDSHGSTMSSERSDSDREDVEVDVEGIVFDCVDSDGLSITHTDADHCYSSMDKAWL